MEALSRTTGCVLVGLSALHVAWGLGSSMPFASRDKLANAVMGTEAVPSKAACFIVAGGLALSSAVVLDAVLVPQPVRRRALFAIAGGFGARALLGWTGNTDKVSPGSNSPTFRQLDRRLYSPICACLAVGAITALEPTPSKSATPGPECAHLWKDTA